MNAQMSFHTCSQWPPGYKVGRAHRNLREDFRDLWDDWESLFANFYKSRPPLMDSRLWIPRNLTGAADTICDAYMDDTHSHRWQREAAPYLWRSGAVRARCVTGGASTESESRSACVVAVFARILNFTSCIWRITTC